MHDMKIMHVDNDGVFIEMVKNFLHNTGIKLMVCREYKPALETIRQERPDIVYLSSRKDGGCVECLRAIKFGAPVKPALPPGMALEFLELTPEITALISRYIHDEHIIKLLR